MVKTQITFDIFYFLIIALGALLLYLFVNRVLGLGSRKKEYFQVGGATNQDPIVTNDSVDSDIVTTSEPTTSEGEKGDCACQVKQAVKKGLCYAQRRIRNYAEENALLKHYVDTLMKQSDEPTNYNISYRKRLSNKYYPVKPAQAFTKNASLILREDDFSTKTFSESKFLAPTKKSKYYGQDVHYGSYLCDDNYPYNDPKVTGNYQMELAPQVRLY
jgi:hypothetical protein